jgi:hypothetical protein
MRIGSVSNIHVDTKFAEKVTKPIQQASLSPEKMAVGTTSISGIYLTLKAIQERKQREENLKNLGLNEKLADKMVRNPVFNKKGIEILSEVSKKDDGTFFSNIMKNVDGIKSLTKENNVYTMSAKTKQGQMSCVMEIQDKSIKTKTEILSDNLKTTITRLNDGKVIEEKTLKTVDGKTVLNETMKYNKLSNSIERQIFNSEKNDQREYYTKYKFSNEGVIEDKIVAKNVFDKTNVKTTLVNEDYEHNTKIKTLKNGLKFDTYFDNYQLYNMHTIEKVIKNPLTGKKEIHKMELSEVPNVYNSTIIDENGNKRIESKGTKDNNGNKIVEKHLESLDGTKTNYLYKASEDNNDISMHYQVVAKDGKVLTTIDRTFKRINDNLAYSSINGHKYKIESSDTAICITDELNGVKTEIKKDETLFWDDDSLRNHEVLNKLSGDMLLDMHNRGYKYHYSTNVGGQSDSYERRLYSSDDVYVFTHEQGHTKDITGPSDIDYDCEAEKKNSTGLHHRIATNPMFKQAFEEERAAFIKAFSEIEKQYIYYYVDKINHYMGNLGGACEMAANANAITSTAQPNEIDNIAYHYLQKYFPRTIATAQNLLNSNNNVYMK